MTYFEAFEKNTVSGFAEKKIGYSDIIETHVNNIPMKFTRFLLLLFSIGCFSAANAKTIFVEYDQSCMDRYEYRYNGAGYGHIAYHIRTSDREKVVLEVGTENKVNRPNRPTNTVSCADLSLNERVVRQINDGETQIYIIRRVGNGYNVSSVGIATYTQISSSFVGFVSVDHKFVYQFNQASSTTRKNLASGNSESQVFFNGVLSNDCPRKLEFERTKKSAGKNYSRMVIIPEIGVIEESIGFNKVDAENNRLILYAINDTPIEKYVNTYCTDKGFNYPHASTFYSESGKHNTTNTSPSGGRIWDLESGNNSTTNNNNNNSGDTGNHGPFIGTSLCTIYKDIDRGLYIDRATGQVANGECGGNTYRNGYMITGSGSGTVSTPSTNTVPPSTTVDVPPVNTNTGTTVVYGDCGEYSGNGYHVVQKNETLYGIARLYGLNVNQIKAWNGMNTNLIKPCMKLYTRVQGGSSVGNGTGEVFASKGNTHTVRRGETIYQLAKKYGYTAERFRSMNNLAGDRLVIGQQLLTSDCNCPNPNRANIPTSAEFVDRGAQSAPAAVRSNAGSRRVHIVKSSETVYSIARIYSIDVDRLRELNDLERDEVIIPYQRLYIN